jgi:hypothetical protein
MNIKDIYPNLEIKKIQEKNYSCRKPCHAKFMPLVSPIKIKADIFEKSEKPTESHFRKFRNTFLKT